jgi:hypothetical protein
VVLLLVELELDVQTVLDAYLHLDALRRGVRSDRLTGNLGRGTRAKRRLVKI